MKYFLAILLFIPSIVFSQFSYKYIKGNKIIVFEKPSFQFLDQSISNRVRLKINTSDIEKRKYKDFRYINNWIVLSRYKNLTNLDQNIIDDTNTSKIDTLFIEHAYFKNRVFIYSDSNLFIQIKDCVFDSAVHITGASKGVNIILNSFKTSFTIGDSFEDSKKLSKRFQPHIFVANNHIRLFNLYNLDCGNVDIYSNNFLRFDIALTDFKNETNIDNCNIEESISYRNNNSYAKLFLTNSYLRNLRISNSEFYSDINFSKSEILDTIYREKNIFINNWFHKMVWLNQTNVKNLDFRACYFSKDSSGIILCRSKINSFSLIHCSRPYLIDLSNLEISNYVKLKFEDSCYYDLKNISISNPHSKIYLDSTDITRVMFKYRYTRLGSIYYDPYWEDKEDKVMRNDEFINIKFDGLPKELEEYIPSGIQRAVTSYADDIYYPPYSWDIKNTKKLSNKGELLEKLLKKFKDERDENSYRITFLENKRFEAFEENPTLFAKLSYHANILWWEYKFRKEKIFLWTLAIFFMLTILNINSISKLNSKAYTIENISERLFIERRKKKIQNVRDAKRQILIAKHPALLYRIIARVEIRCVKYINTVFSKILLSAIYTGFIFFGLKIDAGKFVHRNNVATAWIIFMYTSGLICCAFILHIIIDAN